jgi:hypothetical protein
MAVDLHGIWVAAGLVDELLCRTSLKGAASVFGRPHKRVERSPGCERGDLVPVGALEIAREPVGLQRR